MICSIEILIISLFQILLSNGVIVYVTVQNGELTDITIVRTLSKVLYGQIAFDGTREYNYDYVVLQNLLSYSYRFTI